MQTLIPLQNLRSWARRVGLLMLAFLGLTGCTPLDEPGFTLVLGSDRVLVGLSGSRSIAITLLRSATFTAPVHIDVEGVPAGVHVYVWPNPVPGDRGTLYLRVSSFATPGRYRLTVVAQSETFLRRQQVSLVNRPGFSGGYFI